MAMTLAVLGGFIIGASLGLVALSAAMLVIAWRAHRDNGCRGRGCRQDAGRHGGLPPRAEGVARGVLIVVGNTPGRVIR
jgi:hypothetical protein